MPMSREDFFDMLFNILSSSDSQREFVRISEDMAFTIIELEKPRIVLQIIDKSMGYPAGIIDYMIPARVSDILIEILREKGMEHFSVALEEIGVKIIASLYRIFTEYFPDPGQTDTLEVIKVVRCPDFTDFCSPN